MGQTDLAVRLLVEQHLPALLPALFAGRQVEVLALVQSELKVVERLTDQSGSPTRSCEREWTVRR